MRTSREIKAIFEAKGCLIESREHGTSYRAGGALLIISPELGENWRDSSELSLKKAEFSAFDGTGYDGRGREYSCYLITGGGSWSLVTQGQYEQLPESDRGVIGYESRSGDGVLFFGDSKKDDLGDLAGAFEALGL